MSNPNGKPYTLRITFKQKDPMTGKEQTHEMDYDIYPSEHPDSEIRWKIDLGSGWLHTNTKETVKDYFRDNWNVEKFREIK